MIIVLTLFVQSLPRQQRDNMDTLPCDVKRFSVHLGADFLIEVWLKNKEAHFTLKKRRTKQRLTLTKRGYSELMHSKSVVDLASKFIEGTVGKEEVVETLGPRFCKWDVVQEVDDEDNSSTLTFHEVTFDKLANELAAKKSKTEERRKKRREAQAKKCKRDRSNERKSKKRKPNESGEDEEEHAKEKILVHLVHDLP